MHGAERALTRQALAALEPGRDELRAYLGLPPKRCFLFSETGDLILAKLSPEKYDEISRFHILAPTGECFGRNVVWSHPAFANKCVFARNEVARFRHFDHRE